MITSLNVTKMEGRKYNNDFAPTIQINHNVTLKTPRLIEKKTIFGNKNLMSMEFQMFINYLSPSIGHIMFEGSVDYYVEKGEASAVISAWTDANSKDANEIKTEISNNLMANVIPFASMVAQKMELPPVFPIPRITFGAKEEKGVKNERPSYIG